MWYQPIVTKNQGYLTNEDVLALPCLTDPPKAWSGSATVAEDALIGSKCTTISNSTFSFTLAPLSTSVPSRKEKFARLSSWSRRLQWGSLPIKNFSFGDVFIKFIPFPYSSAQWGSEAYQRKILPFVLIQQIRSTRKSHCCDLPNSLQFLHGVVEIALASDRLTNT